VVTTVAAAALSVGFLARAIEPPACLADAGVPAAASCRAEHAVVIPARAMNEIRERKDMFVDVVVFISKI